MDKCSKITFPKNKFYTKHLTAYYTEIVSTSTLT